VHDLVIDNASVIDGLGGPARAGGVAVTDGRIVAVGGDLGAARRRVDARGLTLAPGIVDRTPTTTRSSPGIRSRRRLPRSA